MTVSKAQQRAVNKYMKENYDRLNLAIPKGHKGTICKGDIQAHAASQGESVNAFVLRAIRETIERDKDLAIAQKVADEHGVTVEEVLADEEFTRVLDRHPDLRALVLGQGVHDHPAGDSGKG